jgi:hypothetical protein
MNRMVYGKVGKRGKFHSLMMAMVKKRKMMGGR